MAEAMVGLKRTHRCTEVSSDFPAFFLFQI